MDLCGWNVQSVEFATATDSRYRYPTLWDQVVPSVVDKVYHACSIHDRLSVFQPCLTKLSKKADKRRPTPTIVEKWFPGCHYDLGRQKFNFLRQNATGLEKLLSIIPSALSATLEPNKVLSDLVLLWMLQSINNEHPAQQVIPDMAKEMLALDEAIQAPDPAVGSGDVYDKGLPYLPFGLLFSWAPVPAFITDAVKVLLAVRDRRIPDDQAKIYRFKERYNDSSPSIAKIGRVTDERYPSRTYQAFEAWSRYLTATGSAQGKVNGVREH